MTVLSKSLIQEFYNGLFASHNRSNADIDFLEKNLLEDLYDYDIAKWLSLFKHRLYALQCSEYDWTRIGQSKRNWSKDNSHVNYHWFKLAKELGIVSHKRVTDIIFPDVEIYDDDLQWFQNSSGSFGALFYDDDFKRLVFLDRIVRLAADKTSLFASYDISAEKYPLSPHEMEQIYAKLKVTRRGKQIKRDQPNSWEDFRQKFIATWGSKIAQYKVDDLMYPLFEIISSYYSELESAIQNGETQSLLKRFYKKDLSILRVEEVNGFYGQCIETPVSGEDPTYLGEVLLSLAQAKDELKAVLPLMEKLAFWVTMQNPAMVIEHPVVDVMYRIQQIGPYYTEVKLANELEKLLDFGAEFERSDLLRIRDLCDGLRDGTVGGHHNWFQEVYDIFGSREEHNQQETFVDICRTGPLIGSFEYVYHRRGANAVFIRVAQILQGWGLSQRYGVEDWFQMLMQELESGVDAVTGQLLSSRPLSHYARPEHDRTYLASLDNAEANYRLNNGCFYDVNSGKSVPFSLRTYECIQSYSSSKFREYPRMPTFTNYLLDEVTLVALKDLINDSLHHEAAQDGDGYILKRGISEKGKAEKLAERVVEYELGLDQMSVKYQIKDSWQLGVVHMSEISLRDIADRQTFVGGHDTQRLMFIMHRAIGSGHARPNLTLSKYFSAYAAYDKFREYTNLLKQNNPTVYENLMNSSMRFSDSVRNFGEIWANGFPDCMSIASKWFSTLFLDHLPEVEFCHAVEFEHIKDRGFCRRDYLNSARRDSQHIYETHHSPEEVRQLTLRMKRSYIAPPHLTAEISDMLKVTDNVRYRSRVRQLGFFSSQSRWDNYARVLQGIEARTQEDLSDISSCSGLTSSEGSVASSLDSGSEFKNFMTLCAKQNEKSGSRAASTSTHSLSEDTTFEEDSSGTNSPFRLTGL